MLDPNIAFLRPLLTHEDSNLLVNRRKQLLGRNNPYTGSLEAGATVIQQETGVWVGFSLPLK